MSADERERQTPDHTHDDEPTVRGGAEPAARDGDLTRRALIQAGWTLPVVLAVKLPTDAFAQYAHGDTGGSHDDVIGGHDDAPPHSDTHGDVPDHTDVPHDDHVDLVHVDGSHVDLHIDGGLHVDTPLHIDVPHIDHIDIQHIDLPGPF
ncbi:MAG: hypothetical protein ACREM3_07625 [Candidatus Rokuibacteriota bacterium]